MFVITVRMSHKRRVRSQKRGLSSADILRTRGGEGFLLILLYKFKDVAIRYGRSYPPYSNVFKFFLHCNKIVFE